MLRRIYENIAKTTDLLEDLVKLITNYIDLCPMEFVELVSKDNGQYMGAAQFEVIGDNEFILYGNNGYSHFDGKYEVYTPSYNGHSYCQRTNDGEYVIFNDKKFYDTTTGSVIEWNRNDAKCVSSGNSMLIYDETGIYTQKKYQLYNKGVRFLAKLPRGYIFETYNLETYIAHDDTFINLIPFGKKQFIIEKIHIVGMTLFLITRLEGLLMIPNINNPNKVLQIPISYMWYPIAICRDKIICDSIGLTACLHALRYNGNGDIIEDIIIYEKEPELSNSIYDMQYYNGSLYVLQAQRVFKLKDVVL